MPTTFITNKPINDLSTLSSGFGSRVSPTGGASSNHKGNDFAVRIGTPVYAAHNAEVIYKGYDAKGWGNFIVLKDPITGAGTLYAHLNSFSKITDPNTGLERDVAVGDQVSGGLQIALSGNTGAASTGAHFHFEVFGSDAISKMDPERSGKYRSPIRDDIRENPRDHLAAAFPTEFPTDVLSGPNAIDIIGDYRDNTLIGNSRPNNMFGLSGSDTYCVNFGDTIIDPDRDGRIIIADDELKQSTLLEGNAEALKDTSGNPIPNKWSLNGFTLTRLGNNLVISKAGANPELESTKTITITDFPFDKEKGFGISIDKAPALTKLPDGSVVVHEYSLVSENYPNLVSPLYPLDDARIRMNAIVSETLYDSATGTSVNSWQLMTLDRYGKIVSKTIFPNDELGKRSSLCEAWGYEDAGGNLQVIFSSYVSGANSKLGFTRYNVAKGQIEAVYTIDGVSDNKYRGLYRSGVSTLDNDLCIVYLEGTVGIAQKIDPVSLNPIEGRVEFNTANPISYYGIGGFTPSNISPPRSINYELLEGVKVHQTGTIITISNPKLIDAPSSRPNSLIPSGVTAASNPNLAEQAFVFEQAVNEMVGSQLKITPAPGRIAISGLNGGGALDLSSFGLSPSEISSRTTSVSQSQMSFDDLMGGKYRSQSSGRRLQGDNSTVVDGDYYYDTDDYSVNATMPILLDNPASYTVVELPIPFSNETTTLIFPDIDRETFLSRMPDFIQFAGSPSLHPTQAANSRQPSSLSPSSLEPSSQSPTTELPSTHQPSNLPIFLPSAMPSTFVPTKLEDGYLREPSSYPSGFPSQNSGVTGHPTFDFTQFDTRNPSLAPSLAGPINQSGQSNRQIIAGIVTGLTVAAVLIAKCIRTVDEWLSSRAVIPVDDVRTENGTVLDEETGSNRTVSREDWENNSQSSEGNSQIFVTEINGDRHSSDESEVTGIQTPRSIAGGVNRHQVLASNSLSRSNSEVSI